MDVFGPFDGEGAKEGSDGQDFVSFEEALEAVPVFDLGFAAGDDGVEGERVGEHFFKCFVVVFGKGVNVTGVIA